MRVIRLVLVLAVLAFGISRGLPWVTAQLGSTRGLDTGSQSGHCVSLVQLARDDFGKAARRNRNPPYDLERWDSTVYGLETTLAQADSECTCVTEGCRRGQNASEALRNLIDAYSEGLRGERMLLDLTQRIARLDEKLDEAKAAARAEG